MESRSSDSHNRRNFLVCSIASFLLFLIGSVQLLSYRILSLELGIINAIVISLLAIPLGYAYMHFFGGFVSTRAIKLYLFITRGTHIVTAKVSELESIRSGQGARLTLRRQLTYFPFIQAVIVSFAIYLSKHHLVPVVSPLAKTSGCDLSDHRGPDHLNNVRVTDGSSSCACTSLPWWLEASNDRRWSISYDHSLTCRGSVWGFHSSLLDSHSAHHWRSNPLPAIVHGGLLVLCDRL